MNLKFLAKALGYRPHSLAGVLRQEFGRKRVAELKDCAALDLVGTAARALDLSESDFLKQIAAELGPPYVERLESVDLSRLPRKFRLSELRRFGAIPVIRDCAISGFVGNNPDFLLGSPGFGRCPLGLAPLVLIERALDESEERYRMLSRSSPAQDAVSATVLKTLIESCKEHGAEALKISLGAEPSYAFTAIGGKSADGAISDVAVDGVRRLLGSLVFGSVAQLEAQTRVSELSCQSDPNRGEFYLRWSNSGKLVGTTEEKQITRL